MKIINAFLRGLITSAFIVFTLMIGKFFIDAVIINYGVWLNEHYGYVAIFIILTIFISYIAYDD